MPFVIPPLVKWAVAALGGAGFADEMISALEERALWSRYGL